MDVWLERITGHNVWATLRQFSSTIDDLPYVDDNQYRAEADRLRWLRDEITGRLTSRPEAVDPHALNNLQQALANLQSVLLTFKSNPVANRGHLSTAARDHTDAVLPALASLPDALSDGKVVTERKAAQSYRKNIENALTATREAIQEAEQAHAHELAAAQARVAEVRKEVDALSATITDEALRVTQQASRLDTALTTQQSAFDKQQTERSSAFRAEQGERETSAATLLCEIEDRAEKAAAEHRDAALEHLAFLTAKSDEAAKLVEATGRHSLTTRYGQYAQQERRNAFWWSVAAVAFALGGFAFIAVQIARISTENLSWQLTVYKMTASFALLAVAGYAGKQASEHRDEERHAKDLQLKLNAFEPFLSRLDDATQARLRAEFADRIFAPRAAKGEDVAETSELDPLAKAVGLAVRAFQDSAAK